QKLGDEDAEKGGDEGDQEGANADADDGQHGDAALRRRHVDEPAGGQLTDEADEAADGEDQPDIGLVPFPGGEIDREEGTKARLDVGHEEGEPVETAFTPAQGGLHRGRPFTLNETDA